MNRLILMATLALFMGTSSLVLAQTTAPVPHPRIKEVHARMHDQMIRVRAGVKSGKLTKEQAQALKASLKAVRAQMQADFTTNGKKELTPDQLAQLNQMLDANSKTIYGEKHDDSTVPAGGSSPAGTSPAAGSAPATN